MTTPDKGLVTAAQANQIWQDSVLSSSGHPEAFEKIAAKLNALIEREVAKARLDELRPFLKLGTIDEMGFDSGEFVGDMNQLRQRIAELKHLAGEQTT